MQVAEQCASISKVRPFSNFNSLTNTKKLIEPHERFEIATFNLRDHFSTSELVRHAQLSATVLWFGKIYWRMVGCSLKCSKARARNLICCNSLISVLPPLTICNKLYCTLKINLKHFSTMSTRNQRQKQYLHCLQIIMLILISSQTIHEELILGLRLFEKNFEQKD